MSFLNLNNCSEIPKGLLDKYLTPKLSKYRFVTPNTWKVFFSLCKENFTQKIISLNISFGRWRFTVSLIFWDSKFTQAMQENLFFNNGWRLLFNFCWKHVLKQKFSGISSKIFALFCCMDLKYWVVRLNLLLYYQFIVFVISCCQRCV